MTAAVEREIDGELGALGTGRERDLAAVLRFDDAPCYVETQAGTATDGLGGEEGFEDVFLVLLGDPRTVIGKADGDAISLAPRADANFPTLRRGVDGVV